MYRRLYGTPPHTPAHGLVPIENEPWLRAKSKLPQFLAVFLGALGWLLGMTALGIMERIPEAPHPLFVILLLLSALAVLVALLCPLVLVGMVVGRDPYQYCPDCLSYMTRGAKVCPFCGFREPAPPGVPPQTPVRQRTRS